MLLRATGPNKSGCQHSVVSACRILIFGIEMVVEGGGMGGGKLAIIDVDGRESHL